MPQHTNRRTQKHKPFTGRKQRSSNLTRRNANFIATVDSVSSGKIRVGPDGKFYPLQKGKGLKMDDIYPGVQVRIQGHKIVDILQPSGNQFGGWFW
jgi:hypothetical protein